ncbi:MAG: DUF4382 domain-containing protein [Halobacterium sp.]
MERVLLACSVLAIAALAGCLGAAGPSDGSVAVYVSDQENAIEDFKHLNVTITQVSLQRADEWRGDHSGHDHRHRDHWVTYDVPNRTVDLTRLQGQNATLLDTVDVANGTYRRVAIRVADVNATLENASANESASVRLPSDRLKVRDEFTVDGGDTVSFVVDVTVVERDGEYVLKPRVSQSGADQPFCRCDGNCTCGGQNKSSGGSGGCDGCGGSGGGGDGSGGSGGNGTDGG